MLRKQGLSLAVTTLPIARSLGKALSPEFPTAIDCLAINRNMSGHMVAPDSFAIETQSKQNSQGARVMPHAQPAYAVHVGHTDSLSAICTVSIQESIMTFIKRVIQGVLTGKAIQWFRNRKR